MNDVKERPIAKGRKRKLRMNTRKHLAIKRAIDAQDHQIQVGAKRARYYRQGGHSRAW